jgi:redox-sensitive bicupin YhaK (pirin superfamily)
MKIKKVQQVLAPPAAHMVGDGFRVHNFFPSGYNMHNQRMSPFYMLDYNALMTLPPSNKVKGVGVHPHRGFETVTIAYHGAIAHGDSYGNKGLIEAGDVQWMTAASGVLDKEYHEENFSKTGGLFQMVQLWVNLPAKDKMSPPKYQAITNERMGKYQLPQQQGVVEVIAGSYEGVQGAASTFTPIELYNIKLRKGATIGLDFPATFNTGFLIIAGAVKVNDTHTAPLDHFVLFTNEGTHIEMEALEDTIVLAMSGAPLHEPIASYGPFLMNTQAELQQAVADYNSGKFGVLADD